MGDESFDGLSLPPVEPWPEPVNGQVLLDDLKRWLLTHIFLRSIHISTDLWLEPAIAKDFGVILSLLTMWELRQKPKRSTHTGNNSKKCFRSVKGKSASHFS